MYIEKAGLSTQEQSVAETTIEELKRLWRGKLQKLCRLRFGNHYLPDNDDGRAMLTALLCFGLTDESALHDAQWCAAELDGLKRQAQYMKWNNVGTLIGLTYEEREECKLWRLQPCDVSPDEVKRRQANRRAKADKERKKRQREQKHSEREKIQVTKNRCEAVLRMLNDEDLLFPTKSRVIPPPRPYHPLTYQGWAPVSRLVELATKSRAFCRPDGHPLSDLRNAVHRALKRLADTTEIETQLVPGQRGMIMLVRKTAAGKADAFCHGGSMASAFPAKAHKTTGFEHKIPASAGKEDRAAMLHPDPVSTPSDVLPLKRKEAL